MTLIKTDSQNYTDIANATRSLTGSTEGMKPEEMLTKLKKHLPKYGVSYDTFDENGKPLTATTYGRKVAGFTGNKTLQTVTFSDGVKEIAPYAFGYSNLESIALPNGITKIDDDAFIRCYNLKSISLPDTLTFIGSYAFEGCERLPSIELPDSLETIEHGAFAFLGGWLTEPISEIIIPKNVKTIGSSVFMGTNCTMVTFKGKPTQFGISTLYPFGQATEIQTINVPWSEGEIPGAPWGATNATINYNYEG